MRVWLTTALEVVGIAVIAVGSWLIFPPLGLIVAGAGLVLIGWRLG